LSELSSTLSTPRNTPLSPVAENSSTYRSIGLARTLPLAMRELPTQRPERGT